MKRPRKAQPARRKRTSLNEIEEGDELLRKFYEEQQPAEFVRQHPGVGLYGLVAKAKASGIEITPTLIRTVRADVAAQKKQAKDRAAVSGVSVARHDVACDCGRTSPRAVPSARRRHLIASAHLPTTAKDGFRTQGLIAERGHADAVKQIAPSPLAKEAPAGTTTSSTSTAPTIAATTDPRGFAFVIAAEAYAYPRFPTNAVLGSDEATDGSEGAPEP